MSEDRQSRIVHPAGRHFGGVQLHAICYCKRLGFVEINGFGLKLARGRTAAAFT
jgi:hypothetical protein